MLLISTKVIIDNAAYLYGKGEITALVVIAPNGEKYQVVAEVTGVEPPNTTYYKLADTLKDIMSTY